MKRFLIIYTIVSLVIGIALYFVTIVVVTSNRNQTVYDEIALQSTEDNDFTDFIKYQSIAYQKLSQSTVGSYNLHLYHIISKSEEEVFNQIVWILLPFEDVKHATSVKDDNDQTNITLYNKANMDVIYESSTDPSYKNFAISSGIDTYGFFIFAPEMRNSMTIGYEIVDYDGQIIVEDDVVFTFQAYNPENLGSFNISFTSQEKEDLLNIGGYFPQALVQNYTVYVLVVIVVGFLVFQFKKKDWIK
jgi:hypothetical protein